MPSTPEDDSAARPAAAGSSRGDDYRDVVLAIQKLRESTDDQSASQMRAEIVERCLPLADHIARRFTGRGEAFDDLLQVARIGVVNAVDRFDAERGVSFLSFAVPTVMGEVKRHFRDSMWTVRVPRRAKEASLSINRASDELVQQLGRSPRPSELAEHLGIPVDDVIDGLMARSAYNAVSIDAEPDDDEGRSIRETLGDDDEHITQIEEIVTLRPALDNLPERERRIITLRFFHAMSQSEIATEVGVSQMHVSRLLTRTLSRLREELTMQSDGSATAVVDE